MNPPTKLSKKRMTLWYMEATAIGEKPYRICYHKPHVYVQQTKEEAIADIYHVGNISGEIDDSIPAKDVNWGRL